MRSETSSGPVVTIGVPVYNGEATLRAALDSLLAQSFSDYEIVISDNASTDSTATICAEYVRRHPKIRYFRQDTNIGGERNFKFVLDRARGIYFMWAAADDVRSPDFLDANVTILNEDLYCVASTSPNKFDLIDAKVVSFALDGANVPTRFSQFFDHCFESHGFCYALIRTDILRECDILGRPFGGFDWAMILFLCSRGTLRRADSGLTLFGAHGVSQRSVYRSMRTRPIELILPFYLVGRHALGLASHFSPRDKARLWLSLAQINIQANFDRLYSLAYGYYRKNFRHIVRRKQT